MPLFLKLVAWNWSFITSQILKSLFWLLITSFHAFLLLIMFSNFPKAFSIMKRIIWMSFDAKQVTLSSCYRPPTISLQTSSFHTLKDPIYSPINRGSSLINFLKLEQPKSPLPKSFHNSLFCNFEICVQAFFNPFFLSIHFPWSSLKLTIQLPSRIVTYIDP